MPSLNSSNSRNNHNHKASLRKRNKGHRILWICIMIIRSSNRKIVSITCLISKILSNRWANNITSLVTRNYLQTWTHKWIKCKWINNNNTNICNSSKWWNSSKWCSNKIKVSIIINKECNKVLILVFKCHTNNNNNNNKLIIRVISSKINQFNLNKKIRLLMIYSEYFLNLVELI